MEHEDKASDEELMIAYQAGNEVAFHELYLRYSGRVFSYLKRRLSDPVWTEDVFQLVFTKLHKTRHQYDSKHKFSEWLFVIANSVLLDFWKTVAVKNRRYFGASTENLPEEVLPHFTPSFESAGVNQVIPEQALASLSQEQSEIIKQRFFDDLSYEEISKKLGLSEQNVRQVLSRAVRKLRSKLNSTEGS